LYFVLPLNESDVYSLKFIGDKNIFILSAFIIALDVFVIGQVA
jgi:hypothetical protein